MVTGQPTTDDALMHVTMAKSMPPSQTDTQKRLTADTLKAKLGSGSDVWHDHD